MVPADKIHNLVHIPHMVFCALRHDHLRCGNFSFIGNDCLLQILIQIRFSYKIQRIGVKRSKHLIIICGYKNHFLKTSGILPLSCNINSVLLRHQMNHRMGSLGIQFCAVGVFPANDMAGELHNGHLHTKAQPQKWHLMLPGITDRADFSFRTPVAETAGNQNAVHIPQIFCGIFICYQFGVYPFDMDNGAAGDAAVPQGLHHADISVVKLNIFSNQSYCHLRGGVAQRVYHGRPVCQVRLRAGKVQTFTGHLGQLFLFHGKRSFIQVFHVQILEDMGAGHIAEKGNLVL